MLSSFVLWCGFIKRSRWAFNLILCFPQTACFLKMCTGWNELICVTTQGCFGARRLHQAVLWRGPRAHLLGFLSSTPGPFLLAGSGRVRGGSAHHRDVALGLWAPTLNVAISFVCDLQKPGVTLRTPLLGKEASDSGIWHAVQMSLPSYAHMGRAKNILLF